MSGVTPYGGPRAVPPPPPRRGVRETVIALVLVDLLVLLAALAFLSDQTLHLPEPPTLTPRPTWTAAPTATPRATATLGPVLTPTARPVTACVAPTAAP